MRGNKKEFVHALATYLAGTNQVQMSIALQLNGGIAKEQTKFWVDIRNATPLFGYPSVEEAEEVLNEFLFGDD